MPTLTWIGKEKVINHHHDVPFRVLDQQYAVGDTSAENKIIHGDNLEALKALLPYYEGRVKCIYIDPPYNTGNENWVYNDNVNDPKIKKWLGKVVGKESEDLSRHDKWLCMMYPRLQLLYKLLSPDGAIFISIDDNEQASLKLMMDEIWGENNFISYVAWQKIFTVKNSAKYLSDMHEYVVVYAKKVEQWKRNLLPRSEGLDETYTNPDNDPRGPWTTNAIQARNYYSLGSYLITAPTGKEHLPPKGTYWRISKETYQNLEQDKRIWWGRDGQSIPRVKKFLSEAKQGVVPTTWWTHSDAGQNADAKVELRNIFEGSDTNLFNTPKPKKLIERILQLATGPNDIILDSFAGSGTTAHAVLNLNQQDGGNRQFILVEMEDYAETITAERVRRVMNGYGDKPGTGGGFSYYTLGEPVFTEDQLLNDQIPTDRIREYVWYTETKTTLPVTFEITDETAHFLGKHYETAYYFYYEPEALTTLDYDFLATIRTPAEQYVIYADNCLLPRDWLQQRRIVFKKIPRDISRF
ncbi:site-specific DNA-methyltransferase [Spirosoma fluminis]